MVITGGHAYVVSEVNDVRAGESAGWPSIYASLSIVDLETLKVKKIIDFAKSEQVFENETLPVGACFVPRIIQKDKQSLRCYFASEDPGKRQSQTWYIDFDLKSETFSKTIHKAKLKTAASTFDMQPQYFHADAAAQGFAREPKDAGLFLFDSFKEIDGKTYIALNNYPGKQNALALVHDDLATFEIIGHYNEPQTVNLSESAVNRLPDGTWMAICRQDGGNWNYYFTTSKDGKTWTVGKELPFVTHGGNSKPTFDKIGDLYYLGWQEKTSIQRVGRSIFNIDVSRDGKNWERKYRFETPKSFQYPTFREHNGEVWLCVTQGDNSRSHKERIMFGKLTPLDAPKPLGLEPYPTLFSTPLSASYEVMKVGARLFSDRDYIISEVPDRLAGLEFLQTTIDNNHFKIKKGGELFALTPPETGKGASQEKALRKLGFERLLDPEFQLFPGKINRVCIYRKTVTEGERFQLDKVVLFVSSKGVKIAKEGPKPKK